MHYDFKIGDEVWVNQYNEPARPGIILRKQVRVLGAVSPETKTYFQIGMMDGDKEEVAALSTDLLLRKLPSAVETEVLTPVS